MSTTCSRIPHSPAPTAAALLEGIHAVLAVPLLREDKVVGGLVIRRRTAGGFAPTIPTLLQTFAGQAVLAIENARLFQELTARGEEARRARTAAEAALADLRRAQDRLIQSEKMASLGQLTAGIAHEIKNPLNFVNNFAGLSVELLDELKETAAPAIAGLAEDERADVDEIVGMLTGNLEKIAEHGRRADGIVKSMLEHSRGVSGERREVDLNALVDEALNLAYHGARAQDAGFNITLEREFDPAVAPIELAPQEMTRVFLNLFGNGFYAATERARGNGEAAYRPTLQVSTRDLGEAVEIRVRDNGTGIPPEIRDQLFQPFFTTKPTGEGTGLGLSISWDIVTQQHGGTIDRRQPGGRVHRVHDPPAAHRSGRGEGRMSVSILVVDDEPDVAEMFRQRFRREARQGTYVLHFAYSGEEALEKIAAGIEPQLIVILSDINMPIMDGLELLREVKTRRPDVPVMMVTAYGDDERRRLAGEYGAAEFITKPVDFERLKAQLGQLPSAPD